VVFAFGGQASVLLRRGVRIGPLTLLCCSSAGDLLWIFRRAVGIMTLAVWSLLGMTDIRAMNATKTLVVGATNAVAVVCFILAGKVWWPQTGVMLIAAVLAATGCAFARRISPHRLRLGISVSTRDHGCLFLRAADRWKGHRDEARPMKATTRSRERSAET